MDMQDFFDFPSDLTDVEKQTVVTSAKYLEMRFIPHLLSGRPEEAPVEEIAQEALRRLEGTFVAERARLIVSCACKLLATIWFINNAERFKSGENIGGRMLACAYIDIEGEAPKELQKALADFATATTSAPQTMCKGQAKEHISASLGYELGDQTTHYTSTYYRLRKELESPEEKSTRIGRRETRADSGRTGKRLDELVAEELNITPYALRKHLRKS